MLAEEEERLHDNTVVNEPCLSGTPSPPVSPPPLPPPTLRAVRRLSWTNNRPPTPCRRGRRAQGAPQVQSSRKPRASGIVHFLLLPVQDEGLRAAGQPSLGAGSATCRQRRRPTGRPTVALPTPPGAQRRDQYRSTSRTRTLSTAMTVLAGAAGNRRHLLASRTGTCTCMDYEGQLSLCCYVSQDSMTVVHTTFAHAIPRGTLCGCAASSFAMRESGNKPNHTMIPVICCKQDAGIS